MQLPWWISTMTYVMSHLKVFKTLYSCRQATYALEGENTQHYMYSTTPYKFIHAWILSVVHLAIIFFSLTKIFFFYYTRHPINPQPPLYCGTPLHLASNGTKSLSSLIWNKHAKSEQQTASGPISVQRDSMLCWSHKHMTAPSVDTKAKSTQRAVSLRVNLWGRFGVKPRHLSRNLCLLHATQDC